MHDVYVGAAHTFQIIDGDDGAPRSGRQPPPMTSTGSRPPPATIIKTFFINDRVNQNLWQVPWDKIKQDAGDLVGTPLVLQEDLQHPSYSTQNRYERGVIYDYDINEEKKEVVVYVSVTDPSVVDRIRNGELEYVSPMVVPRTMKKPAKDRSGVEHMDRIFPLHLAIVGEPAYGKERAKMTHMCEGDGAACHARLKEFTASALVPPAAAGAAEKARRPGETLQDCVSRKIGIIKGERPGVSDDQAAAIAYSMCGEKKGSGGEGGCGCNKAKKGGGDALSEPALEQVPLIRRTVLGLDRAAAALGRMATAASTAEEYHWVDGRYIRVPRL